MSTPANSRLALWLVALLALCNGAIAEDWALVGLGQHQETGRDIYLGGLYLAKGTQRPTDFTALPSPWKMEYRIVARRTSIRSLLGGMLLQSEVATGRTPGPATTEFADGILSAIQSSLYAGDAFDIELEGDVTYAVLNGQILARSSNPDVASYFLLGWISEQGPASTFRNALLAPEVDPDLLARQEALNYSPERGAEVASWVSTPAPAVAAAVEPPATEPVPEESVPEEPAPAELTLQEIVPNARSKDADTSVDPTLLAAPALAAVAPTTDGSPLPAAGGLPATTGRGVADPLEQGPIESPDTPPAAEELPLAALAMLPDLDATPAPEDEVMSLGVQEYSQRLAVFQSSMVSEVYSKIRYPKRAVRRNLQGRLELDVVLSKSGELRAVEVASSSGHDILDRAAVEAAEDAFKRGVASVDPVASVEFSVGPDEMIVPVPVQFRLQ